MVVPAPNSEHFNVNLLLEIEINFKVFLFHSPSYTRTLKECYKVLIALKLTFRFFGGLPEIRSHFGLYLKRISNFF